MNNDEIYLRYTGKGKGILFGVPARDLNEEEAAIHGEARLLASGLYERLKPKKKLSEMNMIIPTETTDAPKRTRRTKKESEA